MTRSTASARIVQGSLVAIVAGAVVLLLPGGWLGSPTASVPLSVAVAGIVGIALFRQARWPAVVALGWALIWGVSIVGAGAAPDPLAADSPPIAGAVSLVSAGGPGM
jgi:hypothetical protein